MDTLTGVTSFVRAAEGDSFVAASRLLGISPSAVGKNIAKLESRLGVRLFHRTTRNLALTEEGRTFHKHCRRILDDLRDAEALVSASAQAPRGVLRIGLPAIGYRFLMPVLPEFRRQYPGIELDLQFDDKIMDLMEQGLDAVIRGGPMADSSLISRRLGEYRFLLCASPAYLAEYGAPHDPADLANHVGLKFRNPSTGVLQRWMLDSTSLSIPTALTCSNTEAIRAAAVAGMGIAYVPDFLVVDLVADDSLIEILAGCKGPTGSFHALWPANRLPSLRLKTMISFLSVHLFAKNVDRRAAG